MDISKQWEYIVFGYLRQEGYLSIIFDDASYFQGNTERECLEDIEVPVNLLIKLGFKIHEKKSILKPTQGLEFLEFVINSINMAITINKDKSEHIILRPKKIILLFPDTRVTQKIFSRAAAKNFLSI